MTNEFFVRHDGKIEKRTEDSLVSLMHSLRKEHPGLLWSIHSVEYNGVALKFSLETFFTEVGAQMVTGLWDSYNTPEALRYAVIVGVRDPEDAEKIVAESWRSGNDPMIPSVDGAVWFRFAHYHDVGEDLSSN